MEQETIDFLADLEKENGGPITYKTYALFFGTTPSPPSEDFEKKKELGGLLYIINRTLFFEDFEKQSGLLGLIMPKRKSVYQKFKTSLPLESISDIKVIRTSKAKAIISGGGDPEAAATVKGFWKKIFQCSVCIKSNTGIYWFLDVIDTEACIKQIKGAL